MSAAKITANSEQGWQTCANCGKKLCQDSPHGPMMKCPGCGTLNQLGESKISALTRIAELIAAVA